MVFSEAFSVVDVFFSVTVEEDFLDVPDEPDVPVLTDLPAPDETFVPWVLRLVPVPELTWLRDSACPLVR